MSTRIVGAGGKDGAGTGGISESSDTLSSVAYARFVDLIGEGEIDGLVNGFGSIYLDGVPLQNTLGTPNFLPFKSSGTVGTQAQLPIHGFSGTVSEVPVGVKLLQVAGKLIRTITDPDADSVRVTIGVSGFSVTSSDGKIGPATVDYKISTRVEGGSWVGATNDTLTGKTNSRYQRSTEVDLTNLGPGPYEVAVERITPDTSSGLVSDSIYFDSFATINYEPFSYPNSALIALEIDGRYFSSVPARAYHVRGLKVRVPTNYNPITRVYTGIWDGTFKMAWTNNPAWCFFDMVTHRRYGLGKRISDSQISKWVIYQLGQYCDEQVPTGLTTNIFSTKQNSGFSAGGQTIAGVPTRDNPLEPRFTLNCVINTKSDAYKVLNNLSSVFRGMAYWGSGQVLLTQDRPATPSIIWTNANIIDGLFTYEGSARADRHTTVMVAWNDPKEDFRPRYEYIEDKDGIGRYGVRPLDMIAFGCTSRSQARRVGLWTLYTERLEKDAIKFRVGLDSANVQPGDVGKIMDNNRAGARWGGRVISSTSTDVTLDAPVTLAAGAYTLSVMAKDGTLVEKAVNISVGGAFTTLTVAIAYGEAPAATCIWTLASTTVVPMLVRVIQIAQVGSSQFDILCLEHNPSKYDAIELGAAFETFNYSFLSYDNVAAVTHLVATENSFKTSVSSVVQTNLEVGWDNLSDPLIRGYRLKVSAAGGTTVNFPEQRDPFKTIFGVLPAVYEVSVTAVNQLGIVGPATTVSLTVLGIDLTPPSNVSSFVSEVIRDGVRFTWDANTAVDYLETELQLGTVWVDGVTDPMFRGRASTYTLASPPSGPYDVVAKHRDTSLNVSLVASHVNDTIPVYVPPVDGAAGADGITFVLSNEAHTVASDVYGNVPSFLGADSFISAYVGGVYSTSLWTYTKTDVNLHSYFQSGVPNHVIVDSMGGTKLLIHSDETAGSLRPIDSSAGAHGIYNPAAVVAETATHAKFGLALPFVDNTESLLEIAFNDDFDLRDQPFSIQFQIYVPSLLSERQFVIGWWGPGTATTDHSWAVLIGTDGKLNFDYSSLLDGADYTITSTLSIPTGTVVECGVSRAGNTLTLKIRGSLQDFAFDKTIRTIEGDLEGELDPGTGIGDGVVPDSFSYATTILYPSLMVESLTVGAAAIQRGHLYRSPVEAAGVSLPTLVSGSLVTSLTFIDYTDGAVEHTAVELPTLNSGSLVVTISYVTYANGAVEHTAIGIPTLVSGSLAVTISYVTYTHGLVENTSIGLPTLVSGTLS